MSHLTQVRGLKSEQRFIIYCFQKSHLTQVRGIEAPDWFVKEFGSKDLGGLILDPTMTKEGWRITAIALRA